MESKEKQRGSVIWALERIKENYKEGELLTLHFDIDRLNLLIEFLQSSEWVKVEDRLPLCYLSGVWDGLCSDNVIVEDKSGRHYIACLNEGILDGSKFQYWYESNDWDITDKCIIKWKSI
jgi:hypothetical protein